VDDPSVQLTEALDLLAAVADELTPEEAADEIDAASLQVFWREWPGLSGWAGSLWRQLNADLDQAATPQSDAEMQEIGGEGG
jgi:hypothetical protein